jgi:hypothetical protein
MKFTVAILLSLSQLLAFGQPEQWDIDVIKTNRVQEVEIFTQVPKTNPEYPLMLWRQASFDSTGRLVQSNCKRCYMQTHREGDWTSDIVQKFSYENARLTRIDWKAFDNRTILFHYADSGFKRLRITLDKNNQRIGLALEYLDKALRETLIYDFDFEMTHAVDDSASQVDISKTTYQYELGRVTKQTYHSDELVDMGRTIHRSVLDVLSTSNDLKLIETTIERLDLRFLKPWYQEATQTKADKIHTIGDNGDIKATFYLDTNGLIRKEEKLIGTRMREFEYHYKCRN